eukprot:TRINITY_DN5320_c0_g1_i5.p1 TRINITY_DN5320_c0_g1~~TRINITY_DN5320_c0_g1_i5.p1  ORF type:complete len:274 (+),score=91.32 TRINITY_DN5320_c0_g1_i5:101-922(+)
MSDYFQDNKAEALNNKDEYSQGARNALQALRQSVNRMKVEAKKLGTDKDNQELRMSIAKIIKDCGEMFGKCKRELSNLSNDESQMDEAEKKRYQRQAKNFMETYTKIKASFDEIAREISEKQKLYIENARKKKAPTASKRNSHSHDLHTNEPNAVAIEDLTHKYQELDEVNIESDIIRERQEDINQIERLMTEVNQMTIDMATEVEAADSKLEQIHENARSTKENTKKALVEIGQGADYQKKSQKKMCCLIWLIILGVGGIVVIILLSTGVIC